MALPESFRNEAEFFEDMLGLLQQDAADLGKLAFLIRRNDRLRFVERVGDEIVQLFPALDLEGEKAEFGFECGVFHRVSLTLTSSMVSSSFCRLSIRRCVHGRLTVWTWLMMPSSK